MGGWEKERKEYLKGKNMTLEKVEELREIGQLRGEDIWEKKMKMQREERWEKIEKSRSNRWYQVIKGKGIPKYLKNGWGETRWQRIARFRIGDGVREGRFWEREEKKKCRICGWKKETWEHIWEECVRGESGSTWQEKVREILGEEGEGEEWLKELERMRESANGGINEECVRKEFFVNGNGSPNRD
ncbi:hypothetical protein RF55_21640 [Lasius niger]|uniref:Uncharacterized protein n=1 Tax=Lasius niger TaxID=67767 RepID=A0A0J7JY97_LASNI|nr:hypothetical protein RF55_21640 [Lasius niger]